MQNGAFGRNEFTDMATGQHQIYVREGKADDREFFVMPKYELLKKEIDAKPIGFVVPIPWISHNVQRYVKTGWVCTE